MANEAKERIDAVLPKGAEVTINGLEVQLKENLHFTIKNADSYDQAAEFCLIQGVDCDLSHIDPVSGKKVTYSKLDASRIEMDVEAEAKPAKAKGKKALATE